MFLLQILSKKRSKGGKMLRSYKKEIITLVLVAMLAVLTSFQTLSYAKYVSSAEAKDEIRVAKYGKLSLIETLDGVVESNDSTEISIKTLPVKSGENLNKSVSVSFLNSEVSTYLFFVIETNNWVYKEGTNEINLLNNGSKILNMDIDDNWSFFKQETIENDTNNLVSRIIFCYEYDVNGNSLTNLSVFNEITTGIISEKDIKSLQKMYLVGILFTQRIKKKIL